MRTRYMLLALVALSLAGCAAIVGGGSKQKVAIKSSPEQATYRVVTPLGVEIASGKTPGIATLARKSEYNVVIELAGYKEAKVPLERGTNGWVWGNLLCGGLIGLIVDFTSGAAYKLEPNEIQIELVTAMYGDGETDTFAVLSAIDNDGQRRVLPVPLIRDSNLAQSGR